MPVYKALVRLPYGLDSTRFVEVRVHAENAFTAEIILKSQYGSDSNPINIFEVEDVKTPTTSSFSAENDRSAAAWVASLTPEERDSIGKNTTLLELLFFYIIMWAGIIAIVLGFVVLVVLVLIVKHVVGSALIWASDNLLWIVTVPLVVILIPTLLWRAWTAPDPEIEALDDFKKMSKKDAEA